MDPRFEVFQARHNAAVLSLKRSNMRKYRIHYPLAHDLGSRIPVLLMEWCRCGNAVHVLLFAPNREFPSTPRERLLTATMLKFGDQPGSPPDGGPRRSFSARRRSASGVLRPSEVRGVTLIRRQELRVSRPLVNSPFRSSRCLSTCARILMCPRPDTSWSLSSSQSFSSSL